MSFVSGTTLQVENQVKIKTSGDGRVSLELSESANLELNPTIDDQSSMGSGVITRLGNDTTTTARVHYWSGSGAWAAAAKTSVTTGGGWLAYALGTNSSTNGMMLQGFVGDDSHGFAKGVPLYLTTSGQLSTTVPASTGNVVRIMGYAVDDDTLYFDPDKTFVVRS